MKNVVVKISLCLLSLFTAYGQAQCHIDTAVLTAQYEVSQSVNGKKHVSQISLYRYQNDVAYVYQEKAISEYWHQQKNGLVELTRYFDDYQQGIEYQASEIQGNTSWQQISDIITPKFIEKMTLENSRDNACQKEQHYVLNTDKQSISLIWLPAIKLVKKLIISSKTTEYSWQLQQLDSSVEKVKLPFKKWQQYKTTDYADVGDNEDDPFLAKMINLGFIEHAASGFYQADGQAMAAEHH